VQTSAPLILSNPKPMMKKGRSSISLESNGSSSSGSGSGCTNKIGQPLEEMSAAMKRHVRMIRNRESASLSRKKKKEYVSSLEDQVKALKMDNMKLRSENDTLKKKLDQLLNYDLDENIGRNDSNQNSIIQGATRVFGTTSSKRKSKVIAKIALCSMFALLLVNLQGPITHRFGKDRWKGSLTFSNHSGTIWDLEDWNSNK